MKPSSLVLAICLLACLPACAQAGVSGSYELSAATSGMDEAPSVARHASWHLSGPLLGARAQARAVGLGVSSIVDTDRRYATAKLLAAGADTQSVACDADLPGMTTIEVGGVANAASVLETDLVLNLLHGVGTARVSVAPSPLSNGVGAAFLPGRTRQSVHSTCPGQQAARSSLLPVVGDYGIGLFTTGEADAALTRSWNLRRVAGAWRLDGTHTDAGVSARANLTFSGSATSLHARCTLPAAGDLARAATLRQARGVLMRAGFPRSIASAHHSASVPAGRYFVAGHVRTARCGSASLSLVRSLGPR